MGAGPETLAATAFLSELPEMAPAMSSSTISFPNSSTDSAICQALFFRWLPASTLLACS